ncbi:MAG: biopolymer transporter ExbD [Prevotella sp.]|nr:biopolymer transporter ExbD [Prevotella sp.]MBQ9648820.1 biopolymer transporter ExbD [Prevotella sp.]
MFHKRFRQQIPELNTTSTADISFMLLIFFLVTSSMDTDKGLLRQMAPPPMENAQPQDVNQDLVMRVALDANDQLTCNDRPLTCQQLTEAVVSMASVHRTDHVVAIQADRATTYEAYFRMQNAIVAAYHQLREQYAKTHYGKSYRHLTSDERALVNDYYPQRISESFTSKKGGMP